MRSTLVHPRLLTPLVPVGYRKDGRPIYPIRGGSEPPNPAPADPPADPPSDPPADPPSGGPPPPSDPSDPNYFPPNTAVAEMTDKQAAAYWRHQAKVQQARVPKNLDELQAAAEKWAQVERERMTPSDKAIAEAREAAKAEGVREAGTKAADAIMRTHLGLRGKNSDDIDAVMRGVNLAGFVGQDGNVDTDALAAFVKTIAGPAQQGDGSGGGNGRGDTGQGRRENQSGSGVAAGRDAYRQKKEGRNSSRITSGTGS